MHNNIENISSLNTINLIFAIYIPKRIKLFVESIQPSKKLIFKK